jgi:Na+/H+-dicarboxylate symporters
MATTPTRSKRLDKTHYLYLLVIIGVVAGIAVGLIFPDFAVGLQPIGTGFVSLIKMMITPVIFCTIVLGVGSIAKATTVGRIGGIALGYFIIMSTFALGIGLVVGNLLNPGSGLDLTGAHYQVAGTEAGTASDFILGIIPVSLLSALTSGNVLQALLIALITGFAIQRMGARGQSVLRVFEVAQTLVFRVLMMIMWVAPLGAFGAIAAVVGASGGKALVGMATMMGGFYITCILFIVVVLGTVLRLVSGVSIFRLMKYLAREYLIIFSTSSSEAALPRLIAKMEHLGVSTPAVGITVPTGYSFNLDGTAIYLTMASIFVSNAVGKPMNIGEQISLLLFMMLASKGAAGVSGAGLATLAGGLQVYRPELVDGIGLIVGIDRFMSEARALTNFTGNAVATVLVGTWTHQIDKTRVAQVLRGEAPFDEQTMSLSDHEPGVRVLTASATRE